MVNRLIRRREKNAASTGGKICREECIFVLLLSLPALCSSPLSRPRKRRRAEAEGSREKGVSRSDMKWKERGKFEGLSR